MKEFTARLYFLKSEEGGRRGPVVSGYRPTFDFGLEHKGQKMYNDAILYFVGVDCVHPGETCEARVVPLHPELLGDALRPNRAFDVTEGTRVVARGEILDQ